MSVHLVHSHNLLFANACRLFKHHSGESEGVITEWINQDKQSPMFRDSRVTGAIMIMRYFRECAAPITFSSPVSEDDAPGNRRAGGERAVLCTCIAVLYA